MHKLTTHFSPVLCRRLAGLSVLAAGLAVVGCSGGPVEAPRYKVSGTVTLDGAPLSEGKVHFVSPESGALDSVDVKEGKFEGQAQAGERRVEIYSPRIEVIDKDGMKSEAQTELIPSEYNKESKLTASVSASGPNDFTFDAKSK